VALEQGLAPAPVLRPDSKRSAPLPKAPARCAAVTATNNKNPEETTMQLIPSLRRIHIKKSERALLLRNGDFERVLRPGRHWLFNWFDALRVEVFATEQAALSHGLSDCLMNLEPAAVAADFCPSRWERARSHCASRTICWLSCTYRVAAGCFGLAFISSAWRS
jgi:hypothetical protein